MKSLLLTVLAGFWIGSAAAHSVLESTTPANQTVVATAPSVVLFTFKKPIRLVRVALTHTGQASGSLDVSSQSGFANQHDIPLKDMGSGPYVIDWRGLSADGHAVSGSFGFTVE